jgi:hypothetical protein
VVLIRYNTYIYKMIELTVWVYASYDVTEKDDLMG